MYEISLDEKDYLEYQLFTASKSKRIKTRRIREWIITVVTFLLLGLILKENKFLSSYFLSLAVIIAILFPFYTRWRYKTHYLKFVREQYKNNFGVNCTIEFNQGQIIATDKTGEVKINTSEINQVNEIANQIFIKFTTGAALIIPKKKVNVEAFKKELKSNIIDPQIKWNEELSWQ